MPLDKFGRSLSSTALLSSRLRYGGGNIKHTIDGHIDAENLRICNVKEPIADADATNKHYVDVEINKIKNSIKNSYLLHTNIYSKSTDKAGRFMIFDVPDIFDYRVDREGTVLNVSCSGAKILLNNKECNSAAGEELIGRTLKIGDIFTFTAIDEKSRLIFEIITRVYIK